MARVTSLLGAFVAIAVLMGVLAAGLMLPVVGAAGTAAREGVGAFDELPGELEQRPLAQRSRIVASDGTLLSTPADENRILVGLDEIAPVMRDAQMAIEDERFYDHGGLDTRALGRALVSNATSDEVQGGSTLTQQYVKLLLQEEAERSGDIDDIRALQARTGMEGYVRKLRELKYAVTLEQRLTKDEILEGYFNLSYYGAQAYGIEAASQRYFGVNAADLNLPQAALLAGVVRAPGIADPIARPEVATERRNVVLDKMLELGMVEEEEWREARDSELELNVQVIQSSCMYSPHPYFCDYVTSWLLANPALGATRDERRALLATGGLTVTTTLQPELAELVSQTAADYTPPGNEYRLASAAAVVEPGTGHVLAFGQSSEYGVDESEDRFSRTAVNWSVDNWFGGSSGFQIGSIAKAYVIIEALEKGVPIEGNIAVRQAVDVDSAGEWNDPEDPEREPDPEEEAEGRLRPAVIFKQEDFQEGCTIGTQEWAVRNAADSGHERVVDFRRAAANSINTAFAALASQAGTCEVRDTMTEMGLTAANGDPYGAGERGVPATFILGADESSPLTVATSYAALAAGGLYCPPVPVLSITDADGNEIELEETTCRQAIDPDVAAGTNELLSGVLTPQGSGRQALLEGGRPAAGKTGSTDNSRDTWFAGYVPQMSIAVWIGSPVDRYDGDLRDFTIGGRYVDGWLFGSKLAAPMWKELMDAAVADEPIEQFDPPSNRILYGVDRPVPDVRGLQVDEAIRTLGEAGFAAEETITRSTQEDGTVLWASPTDGTLLRTGSVVRIGVAGTPTAAPPPASSPGGSEPPPGDGPPPGDDNGQRGG